MKKIILASLALVLFAETVSAQTRTRRSVSTAQKRRTFASTEMQPGLTATPGANASPIILTATLKDGQNSMLVKQGKGTLQFTKNGDKFSNVIFMDSTGAIIRLVPVPAGTQGTPRPDCKYPLPDACFGTANKNIGLCICKPTDISVGYTISFRLNDGRSYVQGNF